MVIDGGFNGCYNCNCYGIFGGNTFAIGEAKINNKPVKDVYVIGTNWNAFLKILQEKGELKNVVIENGQIVADPKKQEEIKEKIKKHIQERMKTLENNIHKLKLNMQNLGSDLSNAIINRVRLALRGSNIWPLANEKKVDVPKKEDKKVEEEPVGKEDKPKDDNEKGEKSKTEGEKPQNNDEKPAKTETNDKEDDTSQKDDEQEKTADTQEKEKEPKDDDNNLSPEETRQRAFDSLLSKLNEDLKEDADSLSIFVNLIGVLRKNPDGDPLCVIRLYNEMFRGKKSMYLDEPEKYLCNNDNIDDGWLGEEINQDFMENNQEIDQNNEKEKEHDEANKLIDQGKRLLEENVPNNEKEKKQEEDFTKQGEQFLEKNGKRIKEKITEVLNKVADRGIETINEVGQQPKLPS